jgi:DTW domain-containing protein YfiP
VYPNFPGRSLDGVGIPVSRRKKPDQRCKTCQMRHELCLCKEIAQCRSDIKITSRISILMHYREFSGTTNTARLAYLSLPGAELFIRGRLESPLEPEKILKIEDFDPVLLYPSEDAVVLEPDFLKQFRKPINLIVPDGNWRQAAKVAKREAFLKDVPRVFLPQTSASLYRLRREPKSGGLATFEAISRALGIIEGPGLSQRLDKLFDKMVTRTLESRGTREAKELLLQGRDQ